MPHSIRLRGPWQFQPLARAVSGKGGSWQLSYADLPPAGVAVLPADWGGVLGNDFRGLVRYERTFHLPTGLEAGSRVWLVIEDVDFQAAVMLNEQPLGTVQLAGSPVAASLLPAQASPAICPARFEITALLMPQNRLTFDVLRPPDSADLARTTRTGEPGGLIGLVRLEID